MKKLIKNQNELLDFCGLFREQFELWQHDDDDDEQDDIDDDDEEV